MNSSSAIALLAAIGSGMMALTGIVFSLVFVSLQFGTSAYSPRLADEMGTQRILPHCLGIFSGTFLYSILAIRTVDLEGSTGITLPAIVVAFAWLVASVVVLVFLVPQIQTLTIANVLERAGAVGREGVEALYAPFDGHSDHRSDEWDLEPTHLICHAGPPRYVIGLHVEELVRLARRHEVRLRVIPSVGDPIYRNEPLVEVVGASSPLPERAVSRAVLVSKRRTAAFNPMYALRLLTDIAIRALSPAINDPTTAVMALDQTQAILSGLGSSALDVEFVADEAGVVRLEFPLPSWEDVVSISLTEIELYGGRSPQVQRRLGRLLADLLERLPEPRRPALQRIADRRRAVIAEAFPDDERREEASGFDRQGLGHTISGGRLA